ncbi:MAG: carboxypeptidase-like regulatory domain-containing protein [Candidatus Acidiferrales bacterium]
MDIARRLFLLSLLPCLLAAASFAGTVTGTVINGTTGKPAAGVDVILIQLHGAMQPVAQTKTDAEGHYMLEHPALGAGPMLIRVVYRGVNYHEPATPGKTTVDIQVFEPTDKAGAFAVTAHAIILQPEGSDLMVGEEYSIQNKTQPPVAYYRAGGSFLFSIPNGAQFSDASVVGTSGMPVTQSPIDKGKNEKAIDYPFRPGDSGVRVAYRVPYPGNQTQLQFVSPYTAGRLAIFAPPTVQVTGGGFAPAGQEQGFSVYMRETVAANTPVSVSVSGTAPPPPQNGAPADSTGGAGTDDSQNPSVNSRADAGGEAPAASVTTLPARLDSLKWILIAGFAAVFALGLLYLWRQPQATPANGASDAPAQSSAPAGRRQGKTRDAPAGVSRSQTVATDLDQKVRGSLDELKDALFRLELRREAGTISEEDYIRERERVQKVLRDLVRG